MKIRLCRWFNLFRKPFLNKVLTLGAIFFLVPLLLLLALRAVAWWTVLLLVGLNLIWFLTYLLGCPATLHVWENALEFTEYYEVRQGDHRRIHFTVSALRDVEYRQNALERRLDVGRLCFRGDVEAEPSVIPGGTKPTVFQIAGIPHFKRFREQMRAFCKETRTQ